MLQQRKNKIRKQTTYLLDKTRWIEINRINLENEDNFKKC
jgi:hypothetical protein